MYRFYRLDKDEHDNDVLTPVDTCAIQGDRIPDIPVKFQNVLFHLGIGPDDRMYVRREYLSGVPDSIITAVEEFVNNAPEKLALPTYFYSHILLNDVERIPHLHLVYYAKNEETVRAFLNG
ncbi:MAG: hypothetical protein M5R41_06725 [Bacteroidia bacterium]|nr:hypothetical protein [Bacteroidia bacterium]